MNNITAFENKVSMNAALTEPQKTSLKGHAKSCSSVAATGRCNCEDFKDLIAVLNTQNPWVALLRGTYGSDEVCEDFSLLIADDFGTLKATIELMMEQCRYQGYNGEELVKRLYRLYLDKHASFSNFIPKQPDGAASSSSQVDFVIKAERSFHEDMNLIILLHLLRGNNLTAMENKLPEGFRRYVAEFRSTYGVVSKVTDGGALGAVTMARIASSLCYSTVFLTVQTPGTGVISQESVGITSNKLRFLIFPCCNGIITRSMFPFVKWILLSVNTKVSLRLSRKVDVKNCISFIVSAVSAEWPSEMLRKHSLSTLGILADDGKITGEFEEELNRVNKECQTEMVTKYTDVDYSRYNL